jgi:uncharacterized tellurite resistance protein B-like protein
MDLTMDVFRALAAIAWADGAVAEAEANALRSAARAAKLGPADLARVDAMLASRVDLADLGPLRLERDEAELLFALACMMSAADGTVADGERAAVARLGDLLGLDAEARTTAAAASHAVADSLGIAGAGNHAAVLESFARAVAEG